jgi:Na+-driven multidrug efflux pump
MTPEEESELSKDFNLFSLMGFVFPSVFAFVFIAVYQMVDGYFIKKFVGELAIAAVDLYYPVISLFIAIGIMLGTGGNAVIVKKVGEGKVKEAGETFSATFIFTVLLSVGLSVICIAFDDPIMKMCGATAGNIE